MANTSYEWAKDHYARLGVDADRALDVLRGVAISLHCWQGDDVGGFENDRGLTGGGIQATGNYPGKARNADELRADLDQALRLIPGKHRLNLHAIYAETGGRKVERDELGPEHFAALDRLGKRAGHGPRFQRHLFLPPQGRRRLHPGQPR